MVCIGIVLSFNVIISYSVPQYVCSGLLLFVAAEVLEGMIPSFHRLTYQKSCRLIKVVLKLTKLDGSGDNDL